MTKVTKRTDKTKTNKTQIVTFDVNKEWQEEEEEGEEKEGYLLVSMSHGTLRIKNLVTTDCRFVT